MSTKPVSLRDERPVGQDVNPRAKTEEDFGVKQGWEKVVYGARLLDIPKKVMRLERAILDAAQLKAPNCEGLKVGASFLKATRDVVMVADGFAAADDFMSAVKRVRDLGKALFCGRSIKEVGTKSEIERYPDFTAQMLGWTSSLFKSFDKLIYLFIIPVSIFLRATPLGDNLSFFYFASHMNGIVSDTLELAREEYLGDSRSVERFGDGVKEAKGSEKIELARKIFKKKIEALKLKLVEDILNILCDICGMTKDKSNWPDLGGLLREKKIYGIAFEASACTIGLIRVMKEYEASDLGLKREMNEQEPSRRVKNNNDGHQPRDEDQVISFPSFTRLYVA